MQKRLLISALLAAWLAFWCGCGGQQAEGPENNNSGQANNGQAGGADGTEDQEGTPAKGATTAGGGTNTNSAGGTAVNSGKLNTSYIAADFAAAVVAHPKRAMQSKLKSTYRSFPEALKRGAMGPGMPMGRGMLGPLGGGQGEEIEEIIGLLAPAEGALATPEGMPPVAPAVITRFSDAKAARMSDRFKKEGEKRAHGGKTYYVRTKEFRLSERTTVPTEQVAATIEEFKMFYPGEKIETAKSEDGKSTVVTVGTEHEFTPGEMNAAYLPDDKTVVTASEALLKKMIDAKDVKSPLVDRLTALGPGHDLAVVVLMDRLRPAVKAGMKGMGPLPPPFAALAGLVDVVKSAGITAGLDADPLLKIDVEAENAGAADQLETQLTGLLQLGKGMYMSAAKQALQQQPGIKPVLDITDKVVNGAAVKKDGTHLIATAPGLTGFDGLAEKLKPLIDSATQAQRRNNLRQLGLAFYNHHDQMGILPHNQLSDDGKPVLSWRVAILPFMEELNLWQQFDLKQPWDSEHNKPLLEETPLWLRSPVAETKPGYTVYLMFQGPGTALEGNQISLSKIADGLSDTVMIIEVSPEKAVPWTKPVDIDFTAADLKQAIGPPPTKEGYPAVFFDGRVGIIPASLDMDTFKRLIRINDGKPSGFKLSPPGE